MSVVSLGAVAYLNARPLVYGLDSNPDFTLRFDVPSRCAALLHAGTIDLGLIPSIEYLRGDSLRVVPDLAIASRGAVASVALFTKKSMRDVRSIALDTSSRTSVALVSVLCARAFAIKPALVPEPPDVQRMLARADAALVIGDIALFQQPIPGVEKIDLGAEWLTLTGMPFVYAFWAGRPGVLQPSHVRALQDARDAGVAHADAIAAASYPDAGDQRAVAAAYLRDNIKYSLGEEERAGLGLFYRYAAEAGVVAAARPVEFY
jgi:chorismate dehydratase